MGELQLEVLVDRMKREFSVVATTGAPQVAYKETIKKIATVRVNTSAKREVGDNMVIVCCGLSPWAGVKALSFESEN